MLLQQIINGLTVGSTYGLVALGYTLIYGVLGLINFAHGEIYMIGAFMGFTTLALANLPFWFSIALSVLGAATTGFFVERIAYRPIRKATKSAQLISALGMSIVLRNLAMLAWGSKTLPFPRVLANDALDIAGARFSVLQAVIPLCAVALMFALNGYIGHTRMGISVRAVSLDPEMASMMGIESNRVIGAVFILGSALGGIAGMLVAMFYASISFDMGVIVGIKSFIAAILGGIGSIHGAMIGGLILGLAESFAAAYISPAYKDALAFVLLLLVLLFKPSGILGVSSEKGG
ncbi:MAG: branched-chain amino acid ABC transporter permease [Firmicutes bacterium]|nr:branched-chain amino acid ABC transporter permease [Bacillota bacterium]